MAKKVAKVKRSAHEVQEDIRNQITNKIVNSLEENNLPWRKSWSNDPNCGFPVNCVSKKNYRGINTLLLAISSMANGFQSKWWGTGKQWIEKGGKIRKGAESTQVVFWKVFPYEVKKDGKVKLKMDGTPEVRTFPMLWVYNVFNLDQIETLDKTSVKGKHLELLRPAQGKIKVVPSHDFAVAQEVVDSTGADIRHGGNKAYYCRPIPEEKWPKAHTDGDYIQVPGRDQFKLEAEYYDTVFHELGHWSELRLGWDHKEKGYAFGELVAEMSACFISGELNLPLSDMVDNHAMYINEWLKAMKQDNNFIFKASSHASKTADFILNFSGRGQKANEAEEAEEGVA